MDKKISQLIAATSPNAPDLLVIVQSGVTKKISYDNLFSNLLSSVDTNRIPRKGPSGTYINSGLVDDGTFISVDSGRKFTSTDPTKINLEFPSNDSFSVTTDGGIGSAGRLLITPIISQLKSSGGMISIGDATSNAKIQHSAQINLDSPEIYLPQTTANKIYYVDSFNVFSPVTIGANLSFSGGTLSATGISGISTNFIPRWNGTTYVNSGLSDDGTNIKVSSGRKITSSTTGEAELAFPSVNSFQLSTDGGALAESYLLGSINSIQVRSGSDFLDITPGTAAYLYSATKIVLDSPIYNFAQATVNKIYYVDTSNNFSPVTIGSGISFSAGTLSASGGSGTVTSVALSLPSIFSVTGSPVTSSGTLSATLINQTANTVFAGPSTGAASAPTFRALVSADIPSGFIKGTIPATSGLIAFGNGTADTVTTSSNLSFVSNNLGVTGTASVSTSLTTPLIIGGSGTTSSLTYRATSGVGATGARHIFQVGNNGATEAMTILNSGRVGIGNSDPDTNNSIASDLAIGNTTGGHGVTIYSQNNNSGTIAFADGTTGSSLLPGSIIYNHSADSMRLYANWDGASSNDYTLGISKSFVEIKPIASSSGVDNVFSVTSPASTGQTAGTETVGINFNLSATITHAANNTIATNRDTFFRARTHAFATAGGTITNAATVAISGPPIAGTNATITNSYALWSQSGKCRFDDGTGSVVIREHPAVAGLGSISFNTSTQPNVWGSNSLTYLNAITQVGFQIGGTDKAKILTNMMQIGVPTSVGFSGFVGADAIFKVGPSTGAIGSAPIKLTPATAVLLNTPEAGAIEVDPNGLLYYTEALGYRGSVPRIMHTALGAITVTNTAVATSVFSPSTPSIVSRSLPANFLKPGKVIRIRGGGVYSSPALASSITIRVLVGATTVASVTTTALVSSGTNQAFMFEADIVCYSTGVSGTVACDGHINYASSTGRTFDDLNNAGATTTIDTTAIKLIDVTAQWDTNTTTRSVTVTYATIEVLN